MNKENCALKLVDEMSVCPHLITTLDGFRRREKKNKWDGKKATERKREP